MDVINKKNPGTKDTRLQDEERLRAIVESIVKSLVNYPEDIQVRCTRGDKTTIYQVDCIQRNLGQILGSRGRTIQSLRNIVAASAAVKGFRAIVEIPYFPT